MAFGRRISLTRKGGSLIAGALCLVFFAYLALAIETVPRRYRIECGALEIEKGAELTIVTLTDGVTFNSRDGTRIESATGLIKVVSRVVDEGMNLGERAAAEETGKVDTKLKPPKEIVKPPAGAAKPPSGAIEPKIAPEDIKYLELAGGVRFTNKDGVMTCDAIYSEDGGRTFRTRGKADFKGAGGNNGMRFDADSLGFESEKSRLSGKGGVRIVLPSNRGSAGGDGAGAKQSGAVTVTAASFDYDIRKELLTLNGSPTVTLDEVKLTAGTLVYSGKSGRVDAKDGVTATFREEGVTATADTAVYTPEGLATFAGDVRIVQSGNGNTLTCDRLDYADSTGDVKAAGDVRLVVPRENMTLTAGEIDGNIQKESGTAKGDPVLTKGESSVKGEEIRFHRESDRIVVEILGQEKTEYVLTPDAFEELK